MENPYQTGDISRATVEFGSLPAADEIVQGLTRTKPWVSLLAVCGFLLSGLCLLALGGSILIISQLINSENGVSSVASPFFTALFSLASSTGSLFLSIKLWRYRTALARADASNPSTILEAIERQRSFWKSLGILALLGGVFLTLLLLLALFSAPITPK